MRIKTVLITGASGNIGKALLAKFHSEGYKIIGTCCKNTTEEANRIVETFKNVEFYEVDLCNRSDVSELIANLKNYKFDAIINNAGMLTIEDNGRVINEFKDFDLESFENVFMCNFFAPLRICLELKDYINPNGNIINIASGAGTRAAYATLSYSSSKAALINLSKSISNSFYPNKKVRVNAILPGWVESQTEGKMGLNIDLMSKTKALTPIGRNGSADDIANVAYILTTEEMQFINGASIVVDGGYSNHEVVYLEETIQKDIINVNPINDYYRLIDKDKAIEK